MTQPGDLRSRYAADGVVSPVRIVSNTEAAKHRQSLENAEAALGALHYKDKVHTVLTSPYALATHPVALDAVEQFIGPNILLYNSTYIVKEPGSESFVAWHQDLTYWGLSVDDAQVSMWLALAPANALSGCMQMIAGSHHNGRVEHITDTADENVLNLGQRVDSVDTEHAGFHPLQPGEASFHHGWTLHSSSPNRSSDRRIGLNVQYIATQNRLGTSDDASAMLVRGVDEHGYFVSDVAPSADLEPRALARWVDLERQMKANFVKGQE